eukprot:TRINITY_DN4112_c0_g1_i9.p1 TRINITY_DN4112_c0_g1~~TRINITY_DN4112_c0_g1_i9.p1  ORF type:complete len:246 (-),score=64.32 TRINITY_DN4112_c0_g1_i9:213-950(-)
MSSGPVRRTAVKSRPGRPPSAKRSARSASRGRRASWSPPGEEVVLRESCGSEAPASKADIAAAGRAADSALAETGVISGASDAEWHASEADKREAKEALARLMLLRQKELLRLKLQAKERQLDQLRSKFQERQARANQAAEQAARQEEGSRTAVATVHLRRRGHEDCSSHRGQHDLEDTMVVVDSDPEPIGVAQEEQANKKATLPDRPADAPSVRLQARAGAARRHRGRSRSRDGAKDYSEVPQN